MLYLEEYDEEHFSKLYDKYSKLILKVAYTYLKNISNSEDIMQEVFIKYINKKPRFSNIQNEKAWFIRVTINLCKDYLKSACFKRKTELKDDISYLQHYEIETLSEVLKLPPKYRIVIYLYYYESYSIKEIASILRVKNSTVGTWLSRARKSLKLSLQGGWDNE